MPAAFVTGRITETFGRSTPAVVCAMIAGLAAIYIPGVVQLSIVAGLTVRESIVIGVLPFLIGDSVKLTAALIVSRRIGYVSEYD